MKTSLEHLLKLDGFTEVTLDIIKQLAWAAEKHGCNWFYQYLSNFTERCDIGPSTYRKHISLIEKAGIAQRLGRKGRDGTMLVFSFNPERLLTLIDELCRAQDGKAALSKLLGAIKSVSKDSEQLTDAKPHKAASFIAEAFLSHAVTIKKMVKRTDLLTAFSSISAYVDIRAITSKILA
ncbi:hypothetical protein P3547_19745 [Vibrio parahaemolyticus]|nr:hypothetical protein [Vibrio parahaemolyticus]